MSIIEFKNARGQVRYQPEHPDGRRLYEDGYWDRPNVGRFSFWVKSPKLYRSKYRASRRVARLIARENREYYAEFKEKA